MKRNHNFKDRTGDVNGMLTVTGLHSIDEGKSRWNCSCECGNKCVINIGNLKSTKSCGCLSAKLSGDRKRLPYGEASFNFVFRNYRRQALKRGYVFELDKGTFRDLTKHNCHYCGAKPSNEVENSSAHTNGAYVYSGIDRVDNSKGYVDGNVVSCCGTCNKMKQTLGYYEFIKHIKRIYNHLKNR